MKKRYGAEVLNDIETIESERVITIAQVRSLFQRSTKEQKKHIYRMTCEIAEGILQDGIEENESHEVFLSWEMLACDMSLVVFDEE